MNQLFNFKYILYFSLFVTLAAAVYFKYQELSHHAMTTQATSIEVIGFNRMPTKPPALIKALKVQNVFLSEINIFAVRENSIKVEEAASQRSAPVVIHPVIQPALAIQSIDSQAAPTPPPLPFKYIGKIFGDGEYQVFLSYQGRNHVLRVGDAIQDLYKIQEIHPPTMVVNYVPLNQLQNINIGE